MRVFYKEWNIIGGTRKFFLESDIPMLIDHLEKVQMHLDTSKLFVEPMDVLVPLFESDMPGWGIPPEPEHLLKFNMLNLRTWNNQYELIRRSMCNCTKTDWLCQTICHRTFPEI